VENLLAPGAITVAYSYIGPSLTEGVYRKVLSGAKDHLEAFLASLTAAILMVNLCFCQ
jgi:enoyl-[acyl-carrier protein] reductase/trans-2-enoyl-CoA reductase (NAD+)